MELVVARKNLLRHSRKANASSARDNRAVADGRAEALRNGVGGVEVRITVVITLHRGVEGSCVCICVYVS